jgi:hypothetical protein
VLHLGLSVSHICGKQECILSAFLTKSTINISLKKNKNDIFFLAIFGGVASDLKLSGSMSMVPRYHLTSASGAL